MLTMPDADTGAGIQSGPGMATALVKLMVSYGNSEPRVGSLLCYLAVTPCQAHTFNLWKDNVEPSPGPLGNPE